jgi:hypothetical protein
MKVHEVITILETANPNADVVMVDEDGRDSRDVKWVDVVDDTIVGLGNG